MSNEKKKETDGFSDQPANESPTRDPSNRADAKFPVTQFSFFILIFSKLPVPWNC